DPDDDIDGTTLSIVTPPTLGTAVIQDSGDGPEILYSAPSSSGTDTVVYEICDAVGLCDTATLAITVIAPSDCTISGTAGPDVLVGTSGDDIICGFDGDDIIDAGDGNDIILGGPGADVIRGDAGDDMILGGRGADELRGGQGKDLIRGRRGADTILGGPGAMNSTEAEAT
ncbi:MAG: adhesin, partial [Lentisphaerae bacterium]|nr:adhesin [Lentisphaerota bacterium]